MARLIERLLPRASARLGARAEFSSRRAGLATLVLVAAGCTAQLKDDEGGGDPAGGGRLTAPAAPGFSTLRRLTRFEYDRSVQDLLGTELRPSVDFPADDLGEEFDTVGSALSLSPLYVIAYERAAHALAEELFSRDDAASRAILSCDVELGGEDCARSILTDFASRAFRRPATESDVEALLAPYRRAGELGESSARGLEASFAAVLLSPAFLFKLELDEAPDSGSARALNGYELVTRLSYALWSTTPDGELLHWAASGAHEDPEELETLVHRMLDDPRSRGFVDAFAGSWLGYRDIEAHEVEMSLFPEYRPELARDMREEAALFFADFLESERPAKEMLAAGFSYLNEALAQHYDVPPPPAGSPSKGGFVRVDTTGTTRSGVLTLGAVLTTTSFAARTSPVRRGHFVLSRLLCGKVPPPPPGVEGLPVDTTGLSLRERLEVHRDQPSCRSCHRLMDPLGFGLEHYDAIGRYRELDEGAPVDASGELPDGSVFDGANELGQLLSREEDFTSCLTRKFATFAVGRLFVERDPWVAYLDQEVAAGDRSLRSILVSVLTSEVFRTRQAGPGTKP